MHYRIVGSGPVALACALFMVRGGVDPRRVQLQLPPAAQARPAPADGARREAGGEAGAGAHAGAGLRRMLALSEGSRQLLARIASMPPGGLIERIEVALSDRSGRTRIEARDFGLSALGHVVPYPDLVAALRTAAGRIAFATAPDDDGRAPIEAAASAASAAPAASAGVATDRVTIHAAGMPRRDHRDGGGFRSRDFQQAALLTEVMAQSAGATAYECFGRHGPLALLPADQGHSPRYAVVWCDDPAITAGRAAMAPERLSAALTEVFATFGTGTSSSPGALRVCAAVEVAPLTRVRRVNSATGNEVWIGNAAQALHPVAGQGLNLGLRDAFELARELADNEFAASPLGTARILQRFATRRRLDRAVTTGVTDLLAAGFTWPLVRPIQSALLTAMDLLPPVRRPLAGALLFGSR